jgi:hypothetical protein
MITLMFHFEVDDHGKDRWTIDSPDLPHLSASAPTLRDCHRMALEQLSSAGVRRADLCYVLDEANSKAR